MIFVSELSNGIHFKQVITQTVQVFALAGESIPKAQHPGLKCWKGVKHYR